MVTHKVHLDQHTRKGRRAIGRAIRRDGFAMVGTFKRYPGSHVLRFTVRRVTGSRRRRGRPRVEYDLGRALMGSSGLYPYAISVGGQRYPRWDYDFGGIG